MPRILLLLLVLTAAPIVLAQSSAPAPAGAQSAPSAQHGASAKAQPADTVPVVMYATAWCPYCAKARAYFKRTGTSYTEHDIEKSADARAEFKRLGGRGVPLILVGDEKMAGFSELAFESALMRATRAR
jgi:glutaredoxin